MSNSFRLFTARGIVVRMHITFPLILIWAAIQFGWLRGQGLSGAIFGVIVFLLLFIIVVLHEFGHSFAAQYYGVSVKQIVLLPIGGVAQLGRIPENPWHEFVIAIAGPLVNFVLAIVMLVPYLVLGLPFDLSSVTDLEAMSSLTFSAIYNYVFVSNLFLGVFNLIPAFPMDGGRVLRALLALGMNYINATRIAVSIGQTLAFLFGLWGFLGDGGFFLILIAIFIYLGAGQEGRMVEVRHALKDLTVGQAFSREVQVLAPETTLQNAIDLTLSSFQADFPVVDNGQLVGLLTQSRLLEALNTHGPGTAVGQIMLTDIQPVSPSEGIFNVQQRMLENKWSALPVTEGNHLLGIITSQDINELYRLVSNQPDLIDRVPQRRPLITSDRPA